ncbi:MAG: response regulator [Bryobacteraceae bacterium]
MKLAGDKLRILVVEDDEWSRDVLARRLQRRGYDVTVAADGREGVRATREQHPDLIVMDLGLPLIDGWEATRLLKVDPATSDIPVIAVTARAMVSDRQKAFEAGCDDYLTKPVDFDRLLRSIDRWLNVLGPAATVRVPSVPAISGAVPLLGDPPC